DACGHLAVAGHGPERPCGVGNEPLGEEGGAAPREDPGQLLRTVRPGETRAAAADQGLDDDRVREVAEAFRGRSAYDMRLRERHAAKPEVGRRQRLVPARPDGARPVEDGHARRRDRLEGANALEQRVLVDPAEDGPDGLLPAARRLGESREREGLHVERPAQWVDSDEAEARLARRPVERLHLPGDEVVARDDGDDALHGRTPLSTPSYAARTASAILEAGKRRQAYSRLQAESRSRTAGWPARRIRSAR